MININLNIVARVIGIQLIIVGCLMLSPVLLSFFGFEVQAEAFIKAFFITAACGAGLMLLGSKDLSIKKREGYLIVAIGWTLMCYFGALPYLLTDSTDFIKGIFESTSGFTTTGATIFDDIESLGPGILLWRSLTQWIGGMGIIVFTIAIFPILGIGGVELFVAESPGPTAEKIHPRIKGVAKRLWLIYVSLTLTLGILLHYVGKLSVFDAINHAMTTMATGGFSTKNASIAHFNSPLVEYIIMTFMFIAGINYTILYFGFKGRWKRVWRSDEFKFYVFLVTTVIMVLTLILYIYSNLELESTFRLMAFNAISLITTTGYVSTDYLSYHPVITMMFFLFIFMGASAGSTSGGIKMIRHLAFFRNAKNEIKRLLHPRAYIRVKIDGAIVPSKTITHILVFLLFYLIIFVSGSILFSFFLTDDPQPMLTAVGAVATSLSNVGPAIGSLGPMDNFSHLSGGAYLFLSGIMIIGRLEIFTILIIFSSRFWKPN